MPFTDWPSMIGRCVSPVSDSIVRAVASISFMRRTARRFLQRPPLTAPLCESLPHGTQYRSYRGTTPGAVHGIAGYDRSSHTPKPQSPLIRIRPLSGLNSTDPGSASGMQKDTSPGSACRKVSSCIAPQCGQ
jgi:hypothetical protein